MKRLILFIQLIFLTVISYPLTTLAQVSGIIADSRTGKPLSGVEVFINKTTTATQSDESGRFALEARVNGFHEIILFKKGYELYRSSMKIQGDRQYKLQLSLNPQKKKKSSPLSQSDLKLLKDKLLGNIPDDSIVFLNTDQLAMGIVGGQRSVSGSALIIQNTKTGYIQYYYLNGLSIDATSQAPVCFESVVSQDVKQSINWEKKRKKYFKGSSRHWLMAMVADRVSEEGYTIRDANGKNIAPKFLLNTSTLADYYKLTIDQPVKVVYENTNNTEQISQVKTNGPLDVNEKGLMINTRTLEVQGDMTKFSLVDQMPLDYEPIAGDVEDVYVRTIERFHEKVYVHTDKPYYYPGEPLWFKGYVNYKEPLWRDSLSKVMYVELINPKKQIALTKTVEIDSGFFDNDFILPDMLSEGTYYLRAYTNLNRNFGDANLFVRPIPILNITDKVIYAKENKESQSEYLSITSDKLIYKPRERINLLVYAKDNEGNSLASNLSLSVTDAAQVMPVIDPKTIIDNYRFEEATNKTLELNYPVEYGVGFRGRFLNNNGKPEKTKLTLLQFKPRNMMISVTDEQGLFSQGGLEFYDTATISFKSEKAKDLAYGRIELLPREVAAMSFVEDPQDIVTEPTQSAQRTISEYEVPKDARLLDVIEVKASKIEEQYEKGYRIKRPYGKADYILKAKDINTSYGNLLMAMQGRFPGLIIRPTESGWVVTTLRSAGNSISSKMDMLVTLNDVPLGGPAVDALGSINPSTVESIEVTTRINVLYGSQGAAGVIAVYTKQGVSSESETLNTPIFQNLTIKGYDRKREFKFPDYSIEANSKTTDYRSTIYWNPEIKTDHITEAKTVSFYAADLPGRYRIIAEGVLANGEPVRSVYFIDIESN